MNGIAEIVRQLRSKGIGISLAGEDLQVAIVDSVDEKTLELIRSNKSAIRDYIRSLDPGFVRQPIPVTPSAPAYPVSDAQRRLWVLSQFEGGSVAYNIPGHVYLGSKVNVACFKKAVHATLERHEILRTVFKEDETGDIKQWVLSTEDLGFEIELKDLRDSGNKQERIRAYMREEVYKPFDLGKGPLLRAALLQTDEEEYTFCYNMHHIISDGWSMEVLTKDVLTFYEIYTGGNNIPPPSLRIQYRDYSAWQLSQLENGAYNAHRAYWLNKFKEEVSVLDLPGMKRRPKLKTHTGRLLCGCLNRELSLKLKTYARERGGSLFMSLLAAWNVLMYRYTSITDIVIGTPVAGREHADLGNQIGFYANTLALRNEIRPSGNFDELFERIKQNTLDAYSHQMYPFDRLVEELGLRRDTGRSAIFDIMLVLQNEADHTTAPGSAGGLKEEALNRITDLGPAISKFDIELTVKEVGDYLLLHVMYNPDVYGAEYMEALLCHYRQIIQALLNAPQEKLSRISYLSEEEKQELLVSFSGTKTHYPADKTVIDLFREQVAKQPDATALEFEERQLSYLGLEEQSNQLAHYLRGNCGVQTGDLLGVKQERSEWMIISVLAILKAGGAYVPIDPEYPQERIDYIENDANCKLCLDEAELNRFRVRQGNYSKGKMPSSSNFTDLAYIIYTSGSTGKPKGVMVEHGNLLHSTLTRINIYKEPTKFLLLSSVAFDSSVAGIFGTLLLGGTLVVASKIRASHTDDILDIIEHKKISQLLAVPSLYKMLLNGFGNRNIGLKIVTVAGEECPESLVHLHYNSPQVKACELYNEYGPTECTVWASYFKYDRNQGFIPTIGKPVDNTGIYLLNEENVLEAVGVTGEICIGGPGVTRGYLNQEALTKEKFIEDPFNKGERLYKTGDLGRWAKDGNLEFMGRKDNQVKIRGYRIEPGEIEHALLKHHEIEEAVVLARANKNNEKELIAYITAKSQQNAGGLRAFLKEQLPDYMLPASYVQLEAMPLSSNGKVNKMLLPDPLGAGLPGGTAYVPPGNKIEEQLVEIWEEVLQKKNIGIKDDFFALGGHSLKAVRLINVYKKEFSIHLSLRDLFTQTSIESHSGLLNTSMKAEFVHIERTAYQDSYPVSDAQKRMWVLSQFEEASVAYTISDIVYLNREIALDHFIAAVDATIERHESLRTVFRENAQGELRQWVLSPEDLGFEISYRDFRKQENRQEKIQAHIKEQSAKLFDLARGPLLRAGLLQVEDNEYVFYYTLHHIISDGWSMNILSGDVMKFYEAYKENRKPALKVLDVQYRDYSVWQLSELKKAAAVAHRNYWKEKLSGELPVLSFPFMKKRPQYRNFKGGTWSTFLDQDISRQLRELCRKNEGTLFHGVLACWLIMLHKYSGATDLITGTSVAGRNHPALHDQIGFYSNSLVLRNTLDPNAGFEEVLRAVIKNTNEAMQHQDYPFNELVADLALKRENTRNPVFDAMLVFSNREAVESYEGVNTEELRHVDSGSKLDLEISVTDLGSLLAFAIIYDTDIFEAPAVKRMIQDYKFLLSLLFKDPGAEIKNISLENETRQEKKKMNLSKLTSKNA